MWESIVAGFLGGLGVPLVWEGILKPKRERRGLASALAEEVARNINRLAALQYAIDRDPARLPFRPRLSSVVFAAVVPRLGEIRHHDIGSIVELYGQFDEVAAEALRFEPSARRLHDPASREPDEPATAQLLARFADRLESVVDLGYIVLDALGANGAPGWTRRRWRPEETPHLLNDDVPQSDTAAMPPNESLQLTEPRSVPAESTPPAPRLRS